MSKCSHPPHIQRESPLHFIWKCTYHYPQDCTLKPHFSAITDDFNGHHSLRKIDWKFRIDIAPPRMVLLIAMIASSLYFTTRSMTFSTAHVSKRCALALFSPTFLACFMTTSPYLTQSCQVQACSRFLFPMSCCRAGQQGPKRLYAAAFDLSQPAWKSGEKFGSSLQRPGELYCLVSYGTVNQRQRAAYLTSFSSTHLRFLPLSNQFEPQLYRRHVHHKYRKFVSKYRLNSRFGSCSRR